MKKHTFWALLLIISLNLFPQGAIGNRRSVKHRQAKSTSERFLATLCVVLAAQSCMGQFIPGQATYTPHPSTDVEMYTDVEGRTYLMGPKEEIAQEVDMASKEALCRHIREGDENPATKQVYLTQTATTICKDKATTQSLMCIETLKELASMFTTLLHSLKEQNLKMPTTSGIDDEKYVSQALTNIEKALKEQKAHARKLTKEQRAIALRMQENKRKFLAECRAKKYENDRRRSSQY